MFLPGAVTKLTTIVLKHIHAYMRSETSKMALATTTDIASLVEEYRSTFTEQQLIVMTVAIEKLGSSFNIAKSNGFIQWKAKRSQPTPQQSTPQQPTPQPTPQPSLTQSTPPTKKRVVVIKKRKAAMYEKITALLSGHQLDIPTSPMEFKLADAAALASSAAATHTGGSIYCLFTDTAVLFVGTTSDTVKNFRLAYKSTVKAIKESQDPQPDTLYGVIIPTEDNKLRVKLRDVIKKSLVKQNS